MGSKKKGGGPKISKIKLKNIKGKKLGTGKKTKSKEVVQARRKLQRSVRRKLANKGKGKNVNEPEAIIEDVLDMIPEADLAHLRQEKARNKFYLVNGNGIPSSQENRRRKKSSAVDNDDLEDAYENKHRKILESMEEESNFLPIKTRKGLEFVKGTKVKDAMEEELPMEEYQANEASENGTEEKDEKPLEVTTAMLLAQRKQKIAEYKVRIGVMASSFLEDPENRLQNLESILSIMKTVEDSVALVIPKLAVLSLQAIFKDVLPLYPIKHHEQEGVKLKKDTRQLQGYEANLLRKYKTYMQRLEKLVVRYCPKKSSNALTEPELKLGKIALQCMCRMLESHPYFNLSTNIVNFIVPLLNNWNPELRQIVTDTVRNVFRNDKRGQISYEIVRRINVLIKTKYKAGKDGMIRKDVLDVLLFLRIKEADLKREKEDEATPGKKMTFEQRKMMSKRQRKKAKELVLLEKELLEASAEENKSRKAHFLTEITKQVFTIYFRTLKSTSRSNILTAVLEGLSKFAHVISVDYFGDLLHVLKGYLTENKIHDRQFLLCISTVLAVLDGQGSTLTLDPTTFHQKLYTALNMLVCGKSESNVALALRCVRLATGRKRMPAHRAIAFVKRLATLALQVEHNDALATLQQLKAVMRVHTTSSVLLDCEGAGGSAIYSPELDDPDHCGAQSSTLWEVVPLMSHYHPWVAKVAGGIVQPEKSEPLPGNLNQMHPEDLTQALTVSAMEFNPKLRAPLENSSKGKGRIAVFRPKTDFFNSEINLVDVESSIDFQDSFVVKVKLEPVED